jgi:hypothetical protein
MLSRRVPHGSWPLTEVGLVRQQEAGFPEERKLRVEHGPQHPWIEVSERGGGVARDKLTAVRRRSAGDRVDEQR